VSKHSQLRGAGIPLLLLRLVHSHLVTATL